MDVGCRSCAFLQLVAENRAEFEPAVNEIAQVERGEERENYNMISCGRPVISS